MTQPLCQVRILTPEASRFEHLRALLSEAPPEMIHARCRHLRDLPPPASRDGDVFLIDHLPADGCDGLRLARRHRAGGGRQPVILLLPPGAPAEAVTLAEARLAGANDCLPDERTDAFILPRIVKSACAQAEADTYHPPPCSEVPSCERARLLDHIVGQLGSMAGRIDAAGTVVTLVGPLYRNLFPDRGDPVGSSGFGLFTEGVPYLRRTLAGEDTMFTFAAQSGGRERHLHTFLFCDEEHQHSVVFLTRDVTRYDENLTRALSESRHQFQLLLERSLDAILLVDDHGMCIEANHAASHLLGYADAELLGRYTDEIGFRDFGPLQTEALTRTWFQSASRVAEFSFTRPDGQVRLLEYAAYRAAPHFHLCILRDLTGQRRLEREILEVSDLEQQRFSQDLHDGLGQHLAGVGYMAAALATRLRGRNAPETTEAGQISDLIGAAIVQTREIARGVYPPDMLTGRLPDMLGRLAESFQAVYHTACSFEEDGCAELPSLPRQTLLHLYRIAQEATNNAHRHGKSGAVSIRLLFDDGRVTLTVCDKGQGFAPDPADRAMGSPGGLGLHMMHYRATMLGGTLTVGPGPDGVGTVVKCVFDPALSRAGSAVTA